MSKLDNLSPDVIRQILKGDTTVSVSPDVAQYVFQIDKAAKVFKGNVSKAAEKLREDFPELTFRTAKERVYDAIHYLHAGVDALPANDWYNFYADFYMKMAELYAKNKALAKYAKTCVDKSLECRIKAAGSDVNPDLLKFKEIIISPDVKMARLNIKENNMQQAWLESIELIDSFDISETDKQKLLQEVKTEIGISDEEAEYMED